MIKVEEYISECCNSRFKLKHNIWNCLQCKKEICKACNDNSFICKGCRNLIIDKIKEKRNA